MNYQDLKKYQEFMMELKSFKIAAITSDVISAKRSVLNCTYDFGFSK